MLAGVYCRAVQLGNEPPNPLLQRIYGDREAFEAELATDAAARLPVARRALAAAEAAGQAHRATTLAALVKHLSAPIKQTLSAVLNKPTQATVMKR